MKYTKLEKIVYALKTLARKLYSYLKAYLVVVLTNQPIKTILHWPNILGWLVKWAIELKEWDIIYQPQLEVKAHALANFVLESTILEGVEV